MSILQITPLQVGLTDVYPHVIYINTNNTLAQVTTTGYLNSYAALNPGLLHDGDMALIVTRTSASSSDVDSGFLQVNFSSGNWNLIQTNSPGSVVLPTIANHIATYTNTTGGLSEDPTTAISSGNIQAGLSGTAGYVSSFPSTAARGSLRLQGVANTGDTLVTISNAAMGQATVVSIPDPGVATATFVLSHGGTQHIAAGNFQVDAGNVIAGSSGNAGTFISYPATAANGTLIVAALNAGAAFDTTIRNSSMGQSSVISIPDPGAATANFILSASGTTQQITTSNLQITAGTLLSGRATGGTSGGLTLYPATTTTGSLVLSPVSNVGNFAATISNVIALGQASVYTLPDPANALARILVGATATPFTTGRILASSGTGGLVADSGILATAVQLNTNIKAAQVSGAGGAGAGPLTITAAGCTTASVICVDIVASSNTVSVAKVTPGTGDFALLLSADPGAVLTISYIMFIAAQ
jgi:hypothetical protein